MDVELIKVDAASARAKLVSYRKAITAAAHSEAKAKVRAEWKQIEAGYKAAARGLPLIELSKAFARGGWDEQGRPRFAVARADQRRVKCSLSDRTLTFWNPEGSEYRPSSTRILVTAPPNRPAKAGYLNTNGIVPMVPPDVLPRPDLDLTRRVILWEAEWLAAPVDPLLLFPIGGDLYAVEAAWDLTPLERAVIAGR